MVFFDTEFTNFVTPQLISIGMVSSIGDTLYVEVPFSIKHCSQFVRDVVLP